jgi:hypothetical protein
LITTADAETVLYRPKDTIEIKPNTIIPYESIEVISRHTLKPLVWHEICVDNIHSVENIQGTRIAITVSFL